MANATIHRICRNVLQFILLLWHVLVFRCLILRAAILSLKGSFYTAVQLCTSVSDLTFCTVRNLLTPLPKPPTNAAIHMRAATGLLPFGLQALSQWMKSKIVAIQMEQAEQSFPLVLLASL